MTILKDLQSLKTSEIIAGKDDIVLSALQGNVISDKYLCWMLDSEVNEFTEQRHQIHSHRTLRNYVRRKFVSDYDLLMGIYVNHSHIGNIKLGDIDYNNRNASVSYLIGDKSFWKRGIGSIVVGLVTEIAYEKLGIEKITAGVYLKNVGSIKVLENNNFIREAVLPKQVLYNGVRHDIALYGKLKSIIGVDNQGIDLK